MGRGLNFDGDGRADVPVAYLDDRAGLSDLHAVIRRRQLTFSAAFLLTLAVAAAIVFLTPAAYRAKSIVMVPSMYQYEDPAAIPIRANAEDEVRISTTVELLKSPKVAEQLALVLTQELGHIDAIPKRHAAGVEGGDSEPRLASANSTAMPVALAKPDRAQPLAQLGQKILFDEVGLRLATQKIQDQTDIRRISSSRLIEISAFARSPSLATKIANGLPETYAEMRRLEQQRDRKKKVERLEVQIKQAELNVYNANLAVAKYMRDKNMLGPQAAQAVQGRVSALEVALANSQAESASRPLNQLLDEQKVLQARLAELSVNYGPGYPEILGLQQQLTELGFEIETERLQVGGVTQARRAEIDATAAALSQEVRSMRRKHFEDLESNAGLQELERQATAAADLMDMLLQRLSRAETESAAAVDPVEIVSRAVEQQGVNQGEILKKLGVGLLGAWFIAIFAALAAEGLDNKVRSADQVRAYLRAPTLAMVPKVNSRKLGPNTLQGYLEKDPSSDFAESVRNLYLELMSQGPAQKQRVVILTSVKAGDGKSTIGSGLAAVAQTFGVAAKVIEFDRRFGSGPANIKTGVELEGSSRSPDDVPGGRDNLPVQKARIRPIDDAKRAGEAVPLLPAQLSDLNDRWGLVIIEAPPILKSRDAKALAANATDVVVVMEWGGVSPGALRAIRKAFGRVDVSAVINRVNMKAHARRGYGDSIDYAAKYA